MNEELLSRLKSRLPQVKFKAGDVYKWSPETKTITYRKITTGESAPKHNWSLLHEVSHAILNHSNYQKDLELLYMEVEAWEQAKKLAKDFQMTIDEDHIQDCLDTYRDWLHKRSTCPRCGVICLQLDASNFTCHNCQARWKVTKARLCRPYRLSTPTPKL